MIEFETEIIDEEAFELNFSDAKAFHNTALIYKKHNQRPSLVFNIASVALERYLVAICDLYGAVPHNHNFITLMRDVETLVNVPNDLNKRIKAMDWIFGICSIDDYRHANPDEADMENVLILCDEVFRLFDANRITELRKLVTLQELEQSKC